jgi:hypothetical protein
MKLPPITDLLNHQVSASRPAYGVAYVLKNTSRPTVLESTYSHPSTQSQVPPSQLKVVNSNMPLVANSRNIIHDELSQNQATSFNVGQAGVPRQ